MRHPKKPRGDGEIGAEAPEERERSGKKDMTKDGGVEADVATASPMTASEGPAAAPAGVREDPSRDGGEPRTGGARLGTRRTPSRAPEARVAETRTTDGIGTFDREVILGKPSAEP